jgi:hypothetical protein
MWKRIQSWIAKKTVDQRLQLYIVVVDLFSIGIFISIALHEIAFGKYFGTIAEIFSWRLIEFFHDRGLMVLLFVILMWQLVATRIEVKNYLVIARSLFGVRKPTEWENVEDRKTLTFRIVGAWCLYLLLAWCIAHIAVFSIIYGFIFLQNIWGYITMGKNIRKYFSDPHFLPRGEINEGLIMRRRVVAEQYLFGKPHVLKESGMAAVCFVAFLSALSGHFLRNEMPDMVPYLLMVTALIGNELIVIKWRRERAIGFEEIDREERQRFGG